MSDTNQIIKDQLNLELQNDIERIVNDDSRNVLFLKIWVNSLWK